MEEFNFEAIKNKALEQLKSGKSLSVKDGAFAIFQRVFLNAALEGETDTHLDEVEAFGYPHLFLEISSFYLCIIKG